MATQPGTQTATPTQDAVRLLFDHPRAGALALPESPSVEWLENALTGSQIKTLLATVAPKALPDELAVFFWTSRRRGLDPFLKQVHFVKRRRRVQNDRGEWGYEEYAVHQTGIDGLRVIANRAKAEDGKRLLAGIKRGSIKDLDGKVIGGWAEVYRHDWTQPAREEVDFEEYVQRNAKGEATGLWVSKPETMIKKCAEAAALRMAFPEDLGDLYIDEEMESAEHITARNRHEDPPVTGATAGREGAFAAAPAAGPVVIEGTATVVEDAPVAPADDAWGEEPGAPTAPAAAPEPAPDPRPGTLAELVKVIATFETQPAADRFFALTKGLLGTGFTAAASIVPTAVDAAKLDDMLILVRGLKAGDAKAKAAYAEALKKGGYQAPAKPGAAA
jgi:phage recombination protein Bet